MTARRCRICGREFSEAEQFCSLDGTRLSSVELDAESSGQARAAGVSEGTVSYANAPRSMQYRDVRDAQEALDALVGTTLDARYRILRVIGEGGMGVVYEALHVLIEKHVAIKVLRDNFTSRADVVERFRQEAKSASRIGHPNIVDVSDFGETPSGQSYIVMEMLTGEDLADVLARVRVLSATRAVRIVYQVARALHATHKKSIVHRDLKPENIYLIDRDGVQDFVKVVDFGVAKMNEFDAPSTRKLTRTGMLFGTPEYMSPEQSLGKAFDHRVDIYALGAILFELLSGRVPFTGDNFMGILAQHGHAPLPTLGSVNPTIQVSPELESVVMRALAKDPMDRYPTMGAFAEELRHVPEMPTATGEHMATSTGWSFGPRPSVDGGENPEARGRRINDSPPPLPPMPRMATPSSPSSYQHASLRFSSGYHAEAIIAQPAVMSRALKIGMVAAVLASALLSALVAQRVLRPHIFERSFSAASESTEPGVRPTHPAPAPPTVAAAPAATQPQLPDTLNTLNTIEVQVRTFPRGASVSAVGTEARCSAAPCALAVPRGKPVTLRAETETASVERTLTFDEDNAEVELNVGASRKLTKTRTSSDLKVPSIFR